MSIKALLAAFCTVFFWASAFVGIRITGRYFDPFSLTLGRLTCALVILIFISLIKKEGFPDKRAWPHIICAAILWFGVYMITLNWGEKHIDSGTAAMLVNTAPLMIALLSIVILKETFTVNLGIGILISFIGVIIVGLSSQHHSATSLAGVILCVIAAISDAIAVIIQKPALRYVSGLQFTTYSALVTTILLLPFAPKLFTEYQQAPPVATGYLIYLGVFPTTIGFLTWAYALKRTSASVLGATTYLSPVLTILLSWLIIGEIPHFVTILGGCLCLLGVGISSIKISLYNRSSLLEVNNSS